MKVIRSVSLPVTPVIFFSFLFSGFLGKVSSLILAHSFCIIAQTANRILEEKCLVASFFWLITGRAKCDSPPTISQKWRFKEFSRIQQPAVHSSVSNPCELMLIQFRISGSYHKLLTQIFLLSKRRLKTHFSYLPCQCLTAISQVLACSHIQDTKVLKAIIQLSTSLALKSYGDNWSKHWRSDWKATVVVLRRILAIYLFLAFIFCDKV